MPSAARQRLPADLWRQGHRKHSSGSPGPIYHSQEIQASPGHFDVFQEDKQHNRYQGSKKNTHKVQRKFHATGRGSPKSVPRSGSADILSVAQSDSDSGSDSGSDSVKAVLSSSVKSDSCLSYNPSQASDAYAMEAAIPPHPSQLPFPPLEWLQTSSKRSLSPAVDGISLQAILGCIVAA